MDLLKCGVWCRGVVWGVGVWCRVWGCGVGCRGVMYGVGVC